MPKYYFDAYLNTTTSSLGTYTVQWIIRYNMGGFTLSPNTDIKVPNTGKYLIIFRANVSNTGNTNNDIIFSQNLNINNISQSSLTQTINRITGNTSSFGNSCVSLIFDITDITWNIQGIIASTLGGNIQINTPGTTITIIYID